MYNITSLCQTHWDLPQFISDPHTKRHSEIGTIWLPSMEFFLIRGSKVCGYLMFDLIV